MSRSRAPGAALLAALLLAAPSPEAQERKPRPTTQVTVGTGVQWDDNANLAAEGSETVSWAPNVRFGLSHAHPVARTFGFNIGGQGVYYRSTVDELSRTDYGGAAGIVWAPSKGFRLQLNQTASSSLARDNQELVDAGIVYAQTRVVRSASSLGMGGRLSSTMSWSLNLGYSFNLFEAGLYDDRTATAMAQLTRALGRRSAVFLSFGGRQSFVSGEIDPEYAGLGRVYGATLGFRRTDRHGLLLTASAGGAYIESTGDYEAIGSATASKQVKRLNFAVNYNRNIENAYGQGRDRLVNNVNATLTIAVWKATASGSFGWTFGRVVGGEAFDQKTVTPGGNLSIPIPLGKDLSASIGYNYQQTDVLAGETRGSNRVDFGIVWSRTLGERRGRR